MATERNMQQGQEGSGSAENQGRSREDQMAQNTDAQDNRQDIKDALGNDANRLSSLKEMGALSGRDDAAGGSSDRMEEQNTGQATDQ